ncbi:MAG: carboxypeptidase-like regulatory domain-containing protein, partial [Paludibacter sp.]
MNHYSNDMPAFSTSRKKMLFSGKSLLILLFFCFSTTHLYAQSSFVVKGLVIDERREAIIGANVMINGTSVGTVTDIKGNFQLKVTKGSTLRVSYIGCVSKEVKVIDNTILKIELVEDSKSLSEVVVVGYGEQKKVSVVGSISTTTGKDLVKSPTGSLGTAMVGRLNGL